MKKVTITLDNGVARWVRIQAAKQNTSVSRLVGRMLRERMRGERRYQAAMKSYLSRKPTPLGGGPYPSREELHDRKSFR